MAEPDRVRLARVLGELATAVAADAGAALYLDDGDGALALAASSGQVASGPRWHRRLLRRESEGRVLVVPVPDAAGGVIVLERSGSADFTRDDRALASLYARQMTDEVSAKSTFRQSLWTRQLEAIQRIAAQLTRLASIEEVGAAICRETRQVMDYDEAHVLLVESDGRLSQVAAVSGPLAGGEPLPVTPDSPVDRAIHQAMSSGAALLVPDVVEPASGRAGAWSMLIVPLRYEGRVSGLICLLKEGVARFDDDDVRLLQVLADQAAVAVENAKLLAGGKELVRELNALLDVTTAASGAADEASLAALLAVKVGGASRMNGCAIWRWESDSTTLRALATDRLMVAPTLDVAEHPARRAVLRDGRPRVLHAESAEREALAVEGGLDVIGASATGAEAELLAGLGFASVLMLPLKVGGRATGLIELYSHDPARTIGAAEMQAYLTMAGSVASGLENARLLEQLRLAADVDQLTGVNNHRYLQDRLRQETARSARSRSPLCVLMLDLDSFKPINDRYGHAEGDRLLRSVAATVRAHVRSNDIVARYGGDEFVVVMPDTPENRGHDVAQRVVAGIMSRRHELSTGELVSVGASAGLAVYPDDGRTAAALLQAADAQMYLAKRGQRAAARRPAELIDPALAPTAG